MPPWLYRVTVTASLHQTHGTHLPLWATVMVPQTPAPLRKGRKGAAEEGENEWVGESAIMRGQCPSGCSGRHLMDHHCACGVHTGLYHSITSTEARGLVIQTDPGSDVSVLGSGVVLTRLIISNSSLTQS